jgi:hypothetical protein
MNELYVIDEAAVTRSLDCYALFLLALIDALFHYLLNSIFISTLSLLYAHTFFIHQLIIVLLLLKCITSGVHIGNMNKVHYIKD